MSAISERSLPGIYLSPGGGPLDIRVVTELSPKEQLARTHADSIRHSFRDFTEMLTRCQIPFPSGRYKLREEGFIYDEIGIPEQEFSSIKSAVGLDSIEKTDREIHAILTGRANLVPLPQETYMAMLMSSGILETAKATYISSLNDEHGEWLFDKDSCTPATDEQVLKCSLPLSYVLFSRFEYELKVAQGKENRALIEKYQRALRVRQGLQMNIIQQISYHW